RSGRRGVHPGCRRRQPAGRGVGRGGGGMTLTAGMATMLPPGAGGRILDFRRRGTPPRRRRRSVLLTLARPLLAAFAVVALPVGLAAWVLTAPLFRLRDVEVGSIA